LFFVRDGQLDHITIIKFTFTRSSGEQ